MRGLGLMVAAELTRADGSPDAARTSAVMAHCLEDGHLVLMSCGADSNVVRFMPPLVVSESGDRPGAGGIRRGARRDLGGIDQPDNSERAERSCASLGHADRIRPITPTSLAVTPRTTLRRKRERGNYDRELLDAVLDEALVCHVGFVAEHGPVVLPMTYVRIGDDLYSTAQPATTCSATSRAVPTCA